MNFFEQELKKILGNIDILKNLRCVGRTCYGTLDKDIRVRVSFTATTTHEHYSAIEVSLLNRVNGLIDEVLIRFEDIFEPVKDRQVIGSGIPYISRSGASSPYKWYTNEPVEKDYEAFTGQIRGYLELFIQEETYPTLF